MNPHTNTNMINPSNIPPSNLIVVSPATCDTSLAPVDSSVASVFGLEWWGGEAGRGDLSVWRGGPVSLRWSRPRSRTDRLVYSAWCHPPAAARLVSRAQGSTMASVVTEDAVSGERDEVLVDGERAVSKEDTLPVEDMGAAILANANISAADKLLAMKQLREKAISDAVAQYEGLFFQGHGSAMDEVEDAIESSLVRIDELHSLFEIVKADAHTATHVLLPQLSVQCTHLLRVFKVIDSLVEVVEILKKSSKELDRRLKEVHRVYDIRNPTGLDKLLGSFSLGSGGANKDTPDMPVWSDNSFLVDPMPILKEARLNWLESGGRGEVGLANDVKVGGEDFVSAGANNASEGGDEIEV